MNKNWINYFYFNVKNFLELFFLFNFRTKIFNIQN